MPEVFRSTIVDAPIEAVWAILRDFGAHDTWHPAIAWSTLEQGLASDRIGATRRFGLGGGERLRERLLELDDAAHRLRYCIVESEVPLSNYVATIRLRPVTVTVTDTARTCWCWSSRFGTPARR